MRARPAGFAREWAGETLVLEEAGDGDADASRSRLVALEPLTVPDASDNSITLANALIQGRTIPAEAPQDAAHVAIAVVNAVEYLSTWNFRRIANPVAATRIEQACRATGYGPPRSARPGSLWRPEMKSYESDPIVAEVRATRARLAARFENDPKAIIKHAQVLQKASGRHCVRYPPRRFERGTPPRNAA